MARNHSARLNFLGVISLLIGIAAFVAMKMPIAGYGPLQIALLGIGVGVLAFLLSLMLRWGSGTPVLGILVSLAALTFVEYSNGTLPGWWAKLHPTPSQQPAPAVVAPPTVVPPAEPQGPQVHSIFDTDKPSGPSDSTHVATPAPAVSHDPPALISPPVPAPTIPQIPTITLSDARAKLAAATTAVEHSLANDPSYKQALADVATADAKRKAALAEGGAGSAQVQDASTEWLDAKSKLKKIVDAAVAKDPAAQAAQRDVSDAEGSARHAKPGVK